MGKKTPAPTLKEIEPRPVTEVFLSIAGLRIDLGYVDTVRGEAAYMSDVTDDLLETFYQKRKDVLEKMVELADTAHSELINQGLLASQTTAPNTRPKTSELLQLGRQLRVLEDLIENFHQELEKYGVVYN
jgi:hypothetical protein